MVHKKFLGLFVFAISILSLAFTNKYCGPGFSILKNTYHQWNGGVKGVKGKVYEVELKLDKSNSIEFTNLLVNGIKYKLNTTVSGDVYHLKAITTDPRFENEINIEGIQPKPESTKQVEGDLIFLEYKIKKTGKIKTFALKKWEYRQKTKVGEALIQ